MFEFASEPTGFSYAEDFIGQATERELLTYVSSLVLEPMVIRGNASKRTVRHFGLRYDYRTRTLRETDPVPAELQSPIERAEKFAQLAKGSIVEALVNRYPAGRVSAGTTMPLLTRRLSASRSEHRAPSSSG